MATMYSPDDPLFFLHQHTQVDRIWAVWQDYRDQTEVDPYGQEFTSPEYYSTQPVFSGLGSECLLHRYANAL